MFDLLDKLLSAYLAWLWFQVIAIIVGIIGLYAFIMWISG